MSARILIAALMALLQPTLAASGAGDVGTVKGADLQLLDEIRRIGVEVARLRDQPFERQPIAVRAPDEMHEVAATIRAYNVLPREQLEARGRAWKDLGLGGEESPRKVLVLIARDLAGMAFDPESDKLLISPERLTDQDFRPTSEQADGSTILLMTGVRKDEPLVGHYLMHLRQRERWHTDSLAETTDELLARTAWAEGEANLLATRYLFEGLGLADEIIRLRLDPGLLLDGALLPPGIDALSGIEGRLVDFVYREGFAQVVDLYKAGGWKRLDEAMGRPMTTRSILHPGASVPAVGPIAVPPTPEGMEIVDEDSLGEQAIVVLVSTLTDKDNLGLMAGDGWAGDRVWRWEPDGRPADGVTAWHSRWRSAEEAKDFEYAFGRVLGARFPDGARQAREAGGWLFRTEDRTWEVTPVEAEVRIRVTPLSAAPPAD